MCGIAGVYRLGSVPPEPGQLAEDRALVQAMLRAMEHRGPDDVGVESLGRATLGARRLAILDVLGGHQPLADAEGRVWASLNGEIYNFAELRTELANRHVFRTRTDTELLPYLYLERGEGAVRALRGMFGLAVFDTVGQRLLLARDALGVKPLYVAQDGGRLLWASELKSLLCDPSIPRDLDQEAFAQYLSLGFVPGERTMFRAVRKLRPGCLIEVTPTAIRHERYWRWPHFLDGGLEETPLGALAEEAERRLADSVQAMLLSDVPLGVLLSGGLDSSLLVALLPEAVRTELRTFTIGFEGAGHHDERRHARRVAKHLGTRHQELMVTCDLAEELPRVVAFLDEPCADPAAVPAHLVARAASSQVKVLLSGTGGDEIFGGYRRYALGSLVRAIRWLPRSLSAAAAEALGRFGLHRGSPWAERSCGCGSCWKLDRGPGSSRPVWR